MAGMGMARAEAEAHAACVHLPLDTAARAPPTRVLPTPTLTDRLRPRVLLYSSLAHHPVRQPQPALLTRRGLVSHDHE